MRYKIKIFFPHLYDEEVSILEESFDDYINSYLHHCVANYWVDDQAVTHVTNLMFYEIHDILQWLKQKANTVKTEIYELKTTEKRITLDDLKR